MGPPVVESDTLGLQPKRNCKQYQFLDIIANLTDNDPFPHPDTLPCIPDLCPARPASGTQEAEYLKLDKYMSDDGFDVYSFSLGGLLKFYVGLVCRLPLYVGSLVTCCVPSRAPPHKA